jgi:hypothetical protein
LANFDAGRLSTETQANPIAIGQNRSAFQDCSKIVERFGWEVGIASRSISMRITRKPALSTSLIADATAACTRWYITTCANRKNPPRLLKQAERRGLRIMHKVFVP